MQEQKVYFKSSAPVAVLTLKLMVRSSDCEEMKYQWLLIIRNATMINKVKKKNVFMKVGKYEKNILC